MNENCVLVKPGLLIGPCVIKIILWLVDHYLQLFNSRCHWTTRSNLCWKERDAVDFEIGRSREYLGAAWPPNFLEFSGEELRPKDPVRWTLTISIRRTLFRISFAWKGIWDHPRRIRIKIHNSKCKFNGFSAVELIQH